MNVAKFKEILEGFPDDFEVTFSLFNSNGDGLGGCVEFLDAQNPEGEREANINLEFSA